MTMLTDRPPTTEPARVLVVDDHRLLAEALQTTLGLHGLDVTLSGCASGPGIIEEARALRPGLVVLDLELTGVGLGSDLVRPLVELGVRVVIVSGSANRVELARCLEAGALGVVSKAEPFNDVLEKIRRAAAGEAVTPVTLRAGFLDELRAHRAAEHARLAPFTVLSAREQAVLGMILEGLTAAEMAAASFVSVATVRTQIRSILQKLDVNTQGAAAALARHAGWSRTEAA